MEEFNITKGINTNLFISQNEIEDFICSICQYVPNPNTALEESKCGHIFCAKCLNSWMQNKYTCPFCRSECLIRSLKSNNKFVYRLMMKFKIKCPYNCIWKGELTDLEKHLKKCDNLNIPCKYNYIGCKFKSSLYNKTNHENKEDKIHFNLALSYIKHIESRLIEKERQMNKLKDKIKSFEEREFNLKEQNELLKKQIKQLKSNNNNNNNNNNKTALNLNLNNLNIVNQLYQNQPKTQRNNNHNIDDNIIIKENRSLEHSQQIKKIPIQSKPPIYPNNINNKYTSRNNEQRKQPNSVIAELQEALNQSIHVLDIQSGRVNTSVNTSNDCKYKRPSTVDQTHIKQQYKMKGNLFSLSAKKYSNINTRFNLNQHQMRQKNNCFNLNYYSQRGEEIHGKARNAASPFYMCENKLHYTMDSAEEFC